jgi:outer membrane protein OmpA-like peptidoglycan-associated protein
MSTASFQHRTGHSRGGSRRAESRGAAPAASAALPRYLTSGKATVTRRPRTDGAETAAGEAAARWTSQRGDQPIASGRIAGGMRGAPRIGAGGGSPLPDGWQASAGTRYGIDAGAVRVHADASAHAMAAGLGANAVTIGNDIFFASGRYAPETAEGEHLLAHELAHVAQQGGEPRAVQCDLAQSMPVTLGVFDINMITQAAGPGTNPGMSGTITFEPDPNGPYSAEIGLIQAINITDVAGQTNPASGLPLDWRNVTDINTGVPGTEAGRMEMMTPGPLGGGSVPAGWYIDSLPSATPRGGNIGPNYIEHFGNVTQFGWLRSPTDVGPASLFDFPQAGFDVDFDFETVAKGTDNQTVYGSLFWGFNIRSGAVVGSSEYAFQQDAASPVFEEALERFRGYYVHEPVILYFDTGDPIPRAGEEAKLADIPDYMDRYPDVMIEIDGWADIRGSEASNLDLAQQRADTAASLLALEGVDPTRIGASGALGFGETQQFSQHGTAAGATQPITAGRLQANRRVEIRFVHTVSNHPIVMP